MKKIIACCSLLLVLFNANAQDGSTIDFNKNPFPPTLVLSAVLDNGFTMEPLDKVPHFVPAKVVFLPMKNSDGSEVAYEGKKYSKESIKNFG